MERIKKVWAAVGHWSTAHWIFTSLGSGAATTLAYIFTLGASAPIAFILGLCVAVLVVIYLKAATAFEADKRYKDAKTEFYRENANATIMWAQNKQDYRRNLITKCRNLVAEYLKSAIEEEFIVWISSYPEFLQIRPHFSEESNQKLSRERNVFVVTSIPADANIHIRIFSSELDRLAKEWDVD